MFAEFINTYGVELMYMAITAIFGYLGIVAKRLYTKHINTRIKRDVAYTVVMGIEQIYKDLHGEEKLKKALEAASEMLAAEGITVSEFELKMLIEAALAGFNDAFNKPAAELGAGEVVSIGFAADDA